MGGPSLPSQHEVAGSPAPDGGPDKPSDSTLTITNHGELKLCIGSLLNHNTTNEKQTVPLAIAIAVGIIISIVRASHDKRARLSSNMHIRSNCNHNCVVVYGAMFVGL